ncbi:MAG: hypothetical protein JW759_00870 [Candidatus Coatesbacteria bacterium]|nr:hypothetical protein [Candidatus Coatesbacteria bacterium]
MDDKGIDKIAQAIAAKIGEKGAPVVLGCGSASSTEYYRCSDNFRCRGSAYECGGAGTFYCYGYFNCEASRFYCYSDFTCYTGAYFYCGSNYNP